MNEAIVDGIGLASAAACLIAAGVCVMRAATATEDLRLPVLRQSVSGRWAYRLVGLAMLIALDALVRHS